MNLDEPANDYSCQRHDMKCDTRWPRRCDRPAVKFYKCRYDKWYAAHCDGHLINNFDWKEISAEEYLMATIMEF